jgi:transcriptional regulator with XRE-family HTH domain
VDVKQKVGDRIRQLRLARKLSQEELAFRAELDRTYVTSVENGKRNISIVNIEKLCKALKISLREFFSSSDFKL